MPEQLAPALPALIEGLGDPSVPVRDESTAALRAAGPSAVPLLVRALNHRRPEVRLAAVALLGECGHDPAALAALQAALTRDDPAFRIATAESLAGMGASDPKTVALLTSLLEDTEPKVRRAAAVALAGMGSPAVAALPTLAGMLQDRDGPARLAAAQALWEIDHRDGLALPVLIASLQDDRLRWEAAVALGNCRDRAAPAVGALVEAMAHEEAHRPFRTPPATAFALGKIGEPALPALIKALDSPKTRIRFGAALALDAMGKGARPAVEPLIATLDDPDTDVRQAAALALSNLGEQSTDMVPVLTEMLACEDDAVRSLALTALRRIAPEVAWQFRDLE